MSNALVIEVRLRVDVFDVFGRLEVLGAPGPVLLAEKDLEVRLP
ncbi:MAG TPA: hypothetical protein VLJ88_17205 [Propionibacteriaceae bacterium]|nr:hypothetical protein [Propionibacteriaceae bacterium]